jgi:hypothetical protein
MPPPDPTLDLVLEALAKAPQRLRALGGSMWPTIPHGTLVELHLPPHRGLPEPGEVVAVRTKDHRFLIHRVVGLRNDGHFLLKGDNCPGPDGWIHPSEWVATVPRMEISGTWQPVPRRVAPKPPFVHRASTAFWRRCGPQITAGITRAMGGQGATPPPNENSTIVRPLR